MLYVIFLGSDYDREEEGTLVLEYPIRECTQRERERTNMRKLLEERISRGQINMH